MDTLLIKFCEACSNMKSLDDEITPFFLSSRLVTEEVNTLISQDFLITNPDAIGETHPLTKLILSKKSKEIILKNQIDNL